MSTHPNVILKCTIQPDGTTRKLARDLLAQNRVEVPDENLPLRLDKNGNLIPRGDGTNLKVSRDEDELLIGRFSYDVLVMESDYDEGTQISGKEGDLVIYDLVTYGYGEEISWDELCERVTALVNWCGEHGLVGRIAVTANYW